MTKTQEYLEKKRIDEIGYPKIYVIKSTRIGVELPEERRVIDIQYMSQKSFYSNNKVVFSDKYVLGEKFPYEIKIEVDKICTSEDGFSSGFGDLWQWSYYCTLSKKDADEYYSKELERVSKKYNVSI